MVGNGTQNIMDILDYLKKHLQKNPGKNALICGEKQLDYKSFLQNVEHLIRKINGFIPQKKSFVAILLNNNSFFLEAFLAIIEIGSIPLIFDVKWTEEQLLRVIEFYNPSFILTHHTFNKHYPDVLKIYEKRVMEPNYILLKQKKLNHKIQESILLNEHCSPLFIGFTSGTTFLPKAFLQTKVAWENSFSASIQEFELKDTCTIIAPGPLTHGLSLYAVIEGFIIGATVIIMEKFDSDHLILYFREHINIAISLVPTMLNKLLSTVEKSCTTFLNIKKIITAGSKLSEAIFNQTKQVFPQAQVYEYYGASELGFITLNKTNNYADSVGKPFSKVKIAILDDNNHEVPAQTIGNIWIQSPFISEGYILKEVGSGLEQHHNWSTVGDQGYLDESNNLFLLGRKGDLIITGGLNVYPNEIEGILKMMDLINEIKVFGLPDPHWGEIICAGLNFKELKQLKKNVLIEHCKKYLPAYKCPRKFYEILEFQKTSSGKIIKSQLLNKIQDGTLVELQ